MKENSSQIEQRDVRPNKENTEPIAPVFKNSDESSLTKRLRSKEVMGRILDATFTADNPFV